MDTNDRPIGDRAAFEPDHVLRSAEERYRAFLQNSSEGIWRFELERPMPRGLSEDQQIDWFYEWGYLAECNRAMAVMYGFEAPGDITGARLGDMVLRDKPENIEYLEAFIRTGYRLQDAESAEIDREGNPKFFLNNLTGVLSDDGALLRAWGTQRDVTAARTREMAIRRAEERYRSLAVAISSIVFTTDDRALVREPQPSWEAYTGQSFAEYRGAGWQKMIHPADRNRIRRSWGSAMATGSAYEESGRLWSATHQRHRYFDGRGVPVHDEDGKVREWVGTITDVHTRVLQHRQMLLLGRLSELLVSSLDTDSTLTTLAGLLVPDFADYCCIYVRDAEGFKRILVRHVHAELEKSLESTVEDPQLANLHHAIIRERRPFLAESLDEDISPLPPQTAETLQGAGIESWIAVPMTARGTALGVLHLGSRPTERRYGTEEAAFAMELARHAAVALDNARLYVEAQSANRAKDEFLATLSHELRTPLTAILGWAYIIENETVSPEAMRTGLSTIRQSATAQARIIDDILDVSRLVSGRIALRISSVALESVIRSALDTLFITAETKTIHLNFEADASPVIRGDQDRLQQVIWNLVANALKFTSQGGHVSIRLTIDGPNARVDVVDDGEGIANEFLPHVFEAFRQADASPTRNYQGLGLGLAIVRYLTELHGGSVSAYSEGKKRGSRFTITFPLAPTEESPRQVLPEKVPPPFTGLTFLIVDDTPSAMEVLAACLDGWGASTRTADSVEKALNILEDGGIDLILSDLAMPERDGFELAERVKASPSLRKIPLIAVTAYAIQNQDDERTGLFDLVLRKPISPPALRQSVAQVLGRPG